MNKWNTRRWRTLIPILLFFCSSPRLISQIPGQELHDHHHRHHEIGFGTGPYYIPGESSWGAGLHIHALFGVTEWLSTGGGVEWLFGTHSHRTLLALFHFHPVHPLDISLGPGISLPDEEHSHSRFKMHGELAAAFELSEHIHLGPSFDVGSGAEDFHISLGLHAGYVFRIHH